MPSQAKAKVFPITVVTVLEVERKIHKNLFRWSLQWDNQKKGWKTFSILPASRRLPRYNAMKEVNRDAWVNHRRKDN